MNDDLIGFYPALVRKGIVRGLDFNVLARRLWKLEELRAEGALPEIRFRAGTGSGVSGHAWGGSNPRIVLTIGHNAELDEAIESLLHELVHIACPGYTHHGELFQRRLIACAREAFGLPLDTAMLLNIELGTASKRAYAIDRAIKNIMFARDVGRSLQLDAELRFEPPPPETEAQIVERRSAARSKLVDDREAHANMMLARWEKKEQHAKRLAAKWRKKVRYYLLRK